MLYTIWNSPDEGIGTRTFFIIIEGIHQSRRRSNIIMVDMGLAGKIAGGGFGVVFFLLTILWFTIWLTKVVAEKITKIINK